MLPLDELLLLQVNTGQTCTATLDFSLNSKILASCLDPQFLPLLQKPWVTHVVVKWIDCIHFDFA